MQSSSDFGFRWHPHSWNCITIKSDSHKKEKDVLLVLSFKPMVEQCKSVILIAEDPICENGMISSGA